MQKCYVERRPGEYKWDGGGGDGGGGGEGGVFTGGYREREEGGLG